MGNFFELIEERHSCRDFTGKPVPYDEILKCIEAARLAPSACNMQPWHFIIVSKEEHLGKVAKCFQDGGRNTFTDNAGAFVIVTEDGRGPISKLSDSLATQKFKAVDIGIAVSHLVLAATELHINSCILGTLNERKLRTLLSIPKDRRIRLAVALGYEKEGAFVKPKERKSMGEILDKETYK